MDVTSTRDLDAAAADPRWADLLAADQDASAFQGPDWLRVWAQQRAPSGEVVVRLFAEGDDLRAVVCEVVESEHVRTLAGGRDVTDYRGPVSAGIDRSEVARAWLDALAGDGVREMHLHGIAADTGWLDQLEAAEGDWELRSRATEDVCPRVDLRGETRDAWLERLDSKERHEFRRKVRKMARDLGGLVAVEVPSDDVLAAVDRFFALAATAEDDKGAFFRDDAMRRFFDAVAVELAPAGVLRIHELHAGGLLAASMISLVHGRDWGLYNATFDATLGTLAPGAVLVGELAGLAASEGFETLDFLRGDEAYKYRFGAVDRAIESAVLVRR